MRHTTQKMVAVASAFACDKCGKTVDAEDSMSYQEAHFIRFVGGYGSVFGDGATVECDLCQECLKELIGQFARVNNG